MPYCNQCGRYIGGGMLCAWCGNTDARKDEENCRGMDGMPTPDGAGAGADDTHATAVSDVEETPSDIGATPSEAEEEEAAMDVTHAPHIRGDVTGEVVSEGRTIVTEPEEETEEPPAQESAEDTSGTTAQKEGLGARLGAKLGAWLVGLFTPREDAGAFSAREMREGRISAVLCYLGVLWAIPYFRGRSNRYVAHHLERGLNLLLLTCLGLTLGAVALVLGVIAPFTMPFVAAISEVVLLAAISMSIWSIVRVCVAERNRAVSE